MRQLASFLLFAFALPAVVAPAMAAETWRWKDDNGVVHYSDTRVPGAERVQMPASPPADNRPTAVTQAPRPAPRPVAKFVYTECVVVAPGNDQVFNSVNTVTASLRISPSMQPDDRVQVMFDGEVYAAWPAQSLSFMLKDVYRGTHTLSVQVLSKDKKPLCTGPSISFHVQQPSLLAPLRQQKKP